MQVFPVCSRAFYIFFRSLNGSIRIDRRLMSIVKGGPLYSVIVSGFISGVVIFANSNIEIFSCPHTCRIPSKPLDTTDLMAIVRSSAKRYVPYLSMKALG